MSLLLQFEAWHPFTHTSHSGLESDHKFWATQINLTLSHIFHPSNLESEFIEPLKHHGKIFSNYELIETILFCFRKPASQNKRETLNLIPDFPAVSFIFFSVNANAGYPISKLKYLCLFSNHIYFDLLAQKLAKFVENIRSHEEKKPSHVVFTF